MKLPYIALLIPLLPFIFSGSAGAEIHVIDDSGRELRLAEPATRIISLAPNLTELLFAAGAGDNIVATVRYSDYPEAAATIPVIGDSHHIDMEAVVSLFPDLIVAWQSGTGQPVTGKLMALDIPVYLSEPDSLESIAVTLQKLGRLGGTEGIANRRSRQLQESIRELEQRYAGKAKVRVFYQFWDRPMFTVNNRHLISHLIELCAGENIFADLPSLTPQVNAEAVLASNPDVIIASGTDTQRPAWLDDWRRWPGLAAADSNRLFFIPPDLIQRHSPRIIHGAQMMCEFIDRSRPG